VLATAGHVFYHHARRRALVGPALVLVALVCVQVTLGALTVLSQKHYIINSLHVVTGGLVLVTSLVLTLRAHRARFGAESHAAVRLGGAGVAAARTGPAAGARV
jgi:cytochrome c oxidase assembly protein subunit 15